MDLWHRCLPPCRRHRRPTTVGALPQVCQDMGEGGEAKGEVGGVEQCHSEGPWRPGTSDTPRGGGRQMPRKHHRGESPPPEGVGEMKPPPLCKCVIDTLSCQRHMAVFFCVLFPFLISVRFCFVFFVSFLLEWPKWSMDFGNFYRFPLFFPAICSHF